MRKQLTHIKTILRPTFGQIARAVVQARSPLICFRAAAAAHAYSHNPMREAIFAYNRQRAMSLCYIPSLR